MRKIHQLRKEQARKEQEFAVQQRDEKLQRLRKQTQISPSINRVASEARRGERGLGISRGA